MKWLPDRAYLKLIYRARIGKRLDLNNPQGFNEKLQWLKLYDRNPLYTKLVDKYAVKQWVAVRIGEQYVVPTYEKWESVEDIEIANLPERFVLKTNHDCGGIAICSDKTVFDLDAAKKKLNKHLKSNYYWGSREWPYKDVKPCVFAEEYLEDTAPSETLGCERSCPDDSVSSGNLSSSVGLQSITDYKFMCYGGEVRCAFTCTGRARGDLRVDFFDNNWNHLPFTRHYPNAEEPPAPPRNLVELQAFAEVLSDNIPFVRVDFYEVGGRSYFGEMTFYPGSGFEEFDPVEWDYALGSFIDLTRAYGCG